MEVHFGVLLVLVLLIFLTYKFLSRNHNFFRLRGIAYLKPALVFGNFYSAFLELEHHEKAIVSIYNYFKTEKIFGIFNFLRPTIIVKDLSLIKQITINQHDNFRDRDSYDIDSILNKSLFNQRGENWKNMRSLMEKYFSTESFEKWHGDRIASNLTALLEHLLKDNKEVKNTSIMFNFQLFLVNTYCDIIFGSESAKNEDKVILLKIMKQVEKDVTSLRGKIKIIFLTYFPRISKLFHIELINSSAYETFRDYANKEMNCICDEDKIGLLHFILKNKNVNSDEQDEIIFQIFAFFIDGFFLTSKLFQACCYELGINESFQDELRKSFIHCNDSKLLHLFVLETLRKWPLINNINRVCNQNCTVEIKNGEKLKFYSGDLIKIPLIILNNDYKYFSDPLAFDVNRFCERNEPILSFGFGPRSCFCANFALDQIKSVLFKIIQNFQILVAVDTYDYTTQFNDLNLDITLNELSTKNL